MESASYLDQIIQILSRIREEDGDVLQQAANWIFETIQAEKCVYFYGCTHAGILTQEAFYRTGGLAIINPIFAPGTLVSDQPITLTSSVERLEGYGKVLVRQYGIEKGDLLFIHSVSGGIACPWIWPLRPGRPAPALLESHRWSIPKMSCLDIFRDKNLYELCNLVIDDHCPYGDALIRLERSKQKAGPGSTTVGVAILNEIVVRAAKRFDEEGCIPRCSPAPMWTMAMCITGKYTNCIGKIFATKWCRDGQRSFHMVYNGLEMY